MGRAPVTDRVGVEVARLRHFTGWFPTQNINGDHTFERCTAGHGAEPRGMTMLLATVWTYMVEFLKVREELRSCPRCNLAVPADVIPHTDVLCQWPAFEHVTRRHAPPYTGAASALVLGCTANVHEENTGARRPIGPLARWPDTSAPHKPGTAVGLEAARASAQGGDSHSSFLRLPPTPPAGTLDLA